MSDFLIPFYFAVDRISVGNIFGLGIQIYLLWYVVLNTTKHMCVYIIMQGYMKDWNLLFSERKKNVTAFIRLLWEEAIFTPKR